MVAALFAVSACSAHYAAERDLAAYPFRYNNFDYQIAWNTARSGDAALVSGALKNVRYAYIDEFSLVITLLASDGRVRSQATVFPLPQFSQMDETVPFRAELPNVSINPGDTLRFMIHYQADDGGEGGGIVWRTTFIVDALTGAEIRQ
jgi:hypothetical protein